MKVRRLHVGHITGSLTATENHFFGDTVTENNEPRTISQMFFKPFETNKQFVFCMRQTLQPMLLIMLGTMAPAVIVAVPMIFIGSALVSALISSVHLYLDNIDSAKWWIDLADAIITPLYQAITNILVLPLAATILVTRSLSTGLQEMGIYDFDAENDNRGMQYS